MKKWVKTENLLAEPDGGEPRPKFGVYRFDDGSFYLGEFIGYKRNGMGVQSLENGDYFFGYFDEDCTDYPYVHFSSDDEYIEFVFEKDWSTGVERYMRIDLTTGEFIYRQRRNGVDVDYGFNLYYPDSDTPNIHNPWISIDYFGHDGSIDNADCVPLIDGKFISSIFKEPFSLTEPSPMFMAHPLHSLDGFVYKDYDGYSMNNSDSVEYGHGIGVECYYHNEEQDRFYIGEFYNNKPSGWVFEHAHLANKNDYLSYKLNDKTYFIFDNNLGRASGVTIAFTNNWSPAIKYEHNSGYLYIGQTESKGYSSFLGPGLRFDITNGEVVTVDFIDNRKCTLKKYYYLKQYSEYYWDDAEGKKPLKADPKGNFTNYILDQPSYFTKRHPLVKPVNTQNTPSFSQSSSNFPNFTTSTSTSSEVKKWKLENYGATLSEPGDEGFGVFKYSSNDYYIGQFMHGGIVEGYGVRRMENGHSIYGKFKDEDPTYPYLLIDGENTYISFHLQEHSKGFDRVINLNVSGSDIEVGFANAKNQIRGRRATYNPYGETVYLGYIDGSGKCIQSEEVERPISIPNDLEQEGADQLLPALGDLNEFKQINQTGVEVIHNSGPSKPGIGVKYTTESGKVIHEIGNFKNGVFDGWALKEDDSGIDKWKGSYTLKYYVNGRVTLYVSYTEANGQPSSLGVYKVFEDGHISSFLRYRYDEDTMYYGETDGKTKGIMGKAFAWNYKYQGGSYMVLNKTQIVKDYGRFSLDKEGNYRRPSFYDSSEDFKG